MKMHEITGELLTRAVSVYMEHAYKSGTERQRRTPVFPPAGTLPEILGGEHPFEDLTGGNSATLAASPLPLAGGSAPRVYALRLGNAAYPHMKLALVEAYFEDEFVFAVDRHDTFHFEPDVPGYQAWCELKEINRLVKESIEGAWHKAGVPTLRGLRESRFKHPDLVRELKSEGHTLLVLDDDEARVEILSGILAGEGYEAIPGPPERTSMPRESALHRARERTGSDSVRLSASDTPGADRVDSLCALIAARRVALVVLDVSYRTGQGPRVANALRMDARTQDIPILGVYSRRDFGPDPDLFDASLRRPYRTEAILQVIEHTLLRRSPGGSGIHKAVP